MTVSANVKGQAVERCYTISSPPTRPYLLSITVKQVPGGVMSNWLHENMRPGSTLRAYGPSGTFTSTAAVAAKSLYLSARLARLAGSASNFCSNGSPTTPTLDL